MRKGKGRSRGRCLARCAGRTLIGSIAMVAVAAVASGAAFAAETPFAYADTRILSMGGVSIAAAEGAAAIYGNPAALAWMQRQEVAASGRYRRYIWEPSAFPEISAEYTEEELAGSYARRGIGISVYFSSRGDAQEVEFRDERNRLLGKGAFIGREWAFAASYARAFSDELSLGATAKYLATDDPYADFSWTPLDLDSRGFAIDVGALWRPNAKFALGLTFDNIVSTKISYHLNYPYTIGSIMAELPKSVSVGIAYRPVEEILVAADMRDVFEDNALMFDSWRTYSFETSYHAGLEWKVVPGFWIRGGYFRMPVMMHAYDAIQPNETLDGGSFGFGFLHRGVAVDLGLTGDNRKEKMEENPGSVRNTTISGSMSVAVKF